LSKGVSVEIIGAGVALFIIFGLSFLFISIKRGKARKAAGSNNTGVAADEGGVSTRSAKKAAKRSQHNNDSHESSTTNGVSTATSKGNEVPPLEFAVSGFLLQPEPLGNIPGTGLPEALIVSAGRAMAYHVLALLSHNNHSTESEAIDSVLIAIWSVIEEKFASATLPQDSEKPAEQSTDSSSALNNLGPVLDLIELTASAEGYAARIAYANRKYTVLIGGAAPVALASAPFSTEMREFVAANIGSDSTQVLVIDGIAYAAIALSTMQSRH